MLQKRFLFYYLTSVISLVNNSNFYIIFLVLFKRPVLLKLSNGLKFYINNLMQAWVIKETVLDNDYQKFHRINKTDTVVDIGASIGDFSVMAGKSSKRVFSFEKDPGLSKLMKLNLKINHSSNVDFNIEEVKSLENIFSNKNIRKCNFLKIDCEGCEYDLLLKSDKVTLQKIKYIAMEAHLFDKHMIKKFDSMLAKLKVNYFSIKIADNPVHGYLKFVYASK